MFIVITIGNGFLGLHLSAELLIPGNNMLSANQPNQP